MCQVACAAQMGSLVSKWATRAKPCYMTKLNKCMDDKRSQMVREIHDHPQSTTDKQLLIPYRNENGVYTRGQMISEAQEHGGYTSSKPDLSPHTLSNDTLSRLKRLAHRHRHDFHYLRRIQWQIIESYLKPGRGEHILDVACGDGY